MNSSPSQPHPKKAALIELGGSHDINLYTQLRFLKHGGYHTTLIVDRKLHKQVTELDHVDELRVYDVEGSGFQNFKTMMRLRRFLIDGGFTQVVFNTAQGPLVRALCLFPYPAHIGFSGSLHSLHKLKGSITQNIISRRLKKYFLLARFLRPKVSKYPIGNLRFEVFYPMFYMAFPNEPTVQKPAGEIWIGIPGVVEYVRKDYIGLAHALAKLDKKLPLKFLLLGSADHKAGNGAEFKALINELGVAEYFKFWNGYVSNEDFHAYSKASDAIMPLIHPKGDPENVYTEYQISGAWNMAYGYKKPLLLASEFASLEDFAKYGIFYTEETLPEVLKNLRAVIASQGELYTEPVWQFEYQAKRYVDFIES